MIEATVRDGARDVVDWLEQHLSAVSMVDWLGLALAAVGFLWVCLRLRSNVRMGRLDIQPLDQDGPPELQARVKALTATIRARVAHAGLLPPPAVPAAAPQATVSAAVAASGLPGAAAFAKLMELAPWPSPRSYELRAMVLAAYGAPPGPAISFWLRPHGTGTELHHTVEKAHEIAARDVADHAYVHVTKNSEQAIPLWGRWHELDAFTAYGNALEAERSHQQGAALEYLRVAALKEPRNLLAQLRAANLLERRAQTPVAQAVALERYRQLAKLEPGLVEARIRAAALAAVLAGSLPSLDDAHVERIAATLAIGTPATLAVTLTKLARSEGRATKWLLRPWYTLARHGRLRNELEPRGRERRELKRAQALSAHCRAVRLAGSNRSPLKRVELGLRSTLVLWGTFGRVGDFWQTDYNAACFYSLLAKWAQADAAPVDGAAS